MCEASFKKISFKKERSKCLQKEVGYLRKK